MVIVHAITTYWEAASCWNVGPHHGSNGHQFWQQQKQLQSPKDEGEMLNVSMAMSLGISRVVVTRHNPQKCQWECHCMLQVKTRAMILAPWWSFPSQTIDCASCCCSWERERRRMLRANNTRWDGPLVYVYTSLSQYPNSGSLAADHNSSPHICVHCYQIQYDCYICTM